MSDTRNSILDAAEKRIRDAGYHGFSFRDIAQDVGIKSSSVHHHFPTKEILAVDVARRYSERFREAVSRLEANGMGRVRAWREIFRRSLIEDGRMCLCGVLGAESAGLPKEVADEARGFFRLGLSDLTDVSRDGALSPARAKQTFAILEGAMMLARTLNDVGTFDEATDGLE